MRSTSRLVHRAVALALCATVTACATTGGYRTAPPGAAQSVDPTVLSEYVKTLPAGGDVRVDRTNGKAIRGALLKATGTAVIVQPRTRIPVPPVEVPLTDIIRIAPDERRGATLAKVIGAGVAAGAAGALAVFFILVAALD